LSAVPPIIFYSSIILCIIELAIIVIPPSAIHTSQFWLVLTGSVVHVHNSFYLDFLDFLCFRCNFLICSENTLAETNLSRLQSSHMQPLGCTVLTIFLTFPFYYSQDIDSIGLDHLLSTLFLDMPLYRDNRLSCMVLERKPYKSVLPCLLLPFTGHLLSIDQGTAWVPLSYPASPMGACRPVLASTHHRKRSCTPDQ